MRLNEIKVIEKVEEVKEAKSAEAKKYQDRRKETDNTIDLNTFMRSVNRNTRQIAKDDKNRSKKRNK